MVRYVRVLLAFVAIMLVIAGINIPAHAQATSPINHIIVVYMENWSFDALYGMFPGANSLANAMNAAPQQPEAKGLICHSCGAKLESGQRFCQNCGVDLTA